MLFIENHHRTLANELGHLLDKATSCLLAVAFVRLSGVALLKHHLSSLAVRGTVRVLCGVDLGLTEPAALRELRSLGAEVRVYVGGEIFHPKGYVVQLPGKTCAIVGSGNVSASGLVTGREWSVLLEDPPTDLTEIVSEFERLWHSPQAHEITDDFLATIPVKPAHPAIVATSTREDHLPPSPKTRTLSALRNDPGNYVVSRRPDHTNDWWFQVYTSCLEKVRHNPDPHLVVICDSESPKEIAFAVPIHYLETQIFPRAHLDTRRNRYMFSVNKKTLEFSWRRGVKMDGRPFLVR